METSKAPLILFQEDDQTTSLIGSKRSTSASSLLSLSSSLSSPSIVKDGIPIDPISYGNSSESEYGNFVSAEEEMTIESEDAYANDSDDDNAFRTIKDKKKEENKNICGGNIFCGGNSNSDPYATDETDEDSMLCKIQKRPFSLPFQQCREGALPSLSNSRNRSLLQRVEDFESNDSSRFSANKFQSTGKLRMDSNCNVVLPSMFKNLSSLNSHNIGVFPVGPEIQYTLEEMLMDGGDLPTDETDLRPRVEVMNTATLGPKIVNDKDKHDDDNDDVSNEPCIPDTIESTKQSPPGTYIQTKNVHQTITVQCRSFHVVTSASLPWMTGTAINPLLRALYINKMNRTAVENAIGESNTKRVWDMMGTVTLVIPWIVEKEDQKALFGGRCFESQEAQEEYVRNWIRHSANLPLEADLDTKGIRILFYRGAYHSVLKSIAPIGRICDSISDEVTDVCILDEPEHLNLVSMDNPEVFKEKFSYVVGIIHTNYVAYLKVHVVGMFFTPFYEVLMALATRYHCDRIVKLSDTVQEFAKEKEIIMNVHGTRDVFLEEGKRRRAAMESNEVNSWVGVDGPLTAGQKTSTNGMIYFIGKLLWAKGLDTMIDLQHEYKSATGNYFPIDIIGSGEEEDEIRRAFHGRRIRSYSEADMTKMSTVKHTMDRILNDIPRSRFEFRKDTIPANFLGRMDHATTCSKYKICVNPSVTEVLCTTTAEAIAAGKFVIIPTHPSNAFFEQFPNVLMYQTKASFVSNLQHAIASNPIPLTDGQLYALSWEAATERCMNAAIITRREARRRERVGQADIDRKAAELSRGSIFDGVRAYSIPTVDEEDKSMSSSE